MKKYFTPINPKSGRFQFGYWRRAALGACLSVVSVNAESLIGLSTTGNLVTFDSATPGSILTSVPVTGLEAGDFLVGIDRRPATGELFGIGSGSHLYRINPITGAATDVGPSGAFTLLGTAFGMDFNPVPDRLRLNSSDGQNLRLNPNNGALAATDTSLSYAIGDSGAGVPPRIVGLAYANNFSGATSTTLYGIDSTLDSLTTELGNTGVLTTIGSLGFNASELVGFDISGMTGVAYASLVAPAGNASQLFTINLASGAATLVGTIGGGVPMSGLAATTTPAAAVPESGDSILLLGGGMVALLACTIRSRSGTNARLA